MINALAELHEELERHVTTLLLSRAHREVRATLDHGGATRRIGAEYIYRRSYPAAMDFVPAPGGGRAQ